MTTAESESIYLSTLNEIRQAFARARKKKCLSYDDLMREAETSKGTIGKLVAARPVTEENVHKMNVELLAVIRVAAELGFELTVRSKDEPVTMQRDSKELPDPEPPEWMREPSTVEPIGPAETEAPPSPKPSLPSVPDFMF